MSDSKARTEYLKKENETKAVEEKLTLWQQVKAQFDKLKAEELKRRNELCAFILGDKIKGSKTAVIGERKATATAKLNVTVDKDALKAIWADLTIAEKKSIRFKPEIVAKEYNKLPKNAKIHQVITEKPGTPALAIKS